MERIVDRIPKNQCKIQKGYISVYDTSGNTRLGKLLNKYRKQYNMLTWYKVAGEYIEIYVREI